MTDEAEPMEVELKLMLPGPEAETATVEKMREAGYRVKELKPVTNLDLYMDTFDWLLRKNKLSLRYRTAAGKAMYTVKNLVPLEAGIAERRETEIALDGSLEVPANVQVKKIKAIIDDIIKPRRLLEHLQIRTERRRYRVVSPERAKIELAFDTAHFSLRGLHRARPARRLYELEAELLSGSPAALINLAALLDSAFHYPPSRMSKFESAIERFNIAIPSKKPPDEHTVRSDDRLDLAVRKILAYQLHRFRECIPGIVSDLDTEFVHQARVAIRRIRSALRLFQESLPQETGKALARELKWLGSLLGALRDLDVFLLNLLDFREQIGSFPHKQEEFFKNLIAERRQGPLTALTAALGSPRFRNFERRLDRFLHAPLPLRPRATLALKTVHEVTPALITEKFVAVLDQGTIVLSNPTLTEFHLLRIQMKRLRYACEFIATAYGSVIDPFIERIVEMQDCLGEIQDTVIMRSFIDSLVDEWKQKMVSPKLIFVLGEIYQLQGDLAVRRQREFRKIWERFSSEATIERLQGIWEKRE